MVAGAQLGEPALPDPGRLVVDILGDEAADEGLSLLEVRSHLLQVGDALDPPLPGFVVQAGWPARNLAGAGGQVGHPLGQGFHPLGDLMDEIGKGLGPAAPREEAFQIPGEAVAGHGPSPP